MILKARASQWNFPGRTLIMGIVNVTPDSFSDGGDFLDPTHAIEHGVRMAQEGADILDVGGESTRPGAREVSANLEIERVLPVIKGLRERVQIPLSIDTRKLEVASAAIQSGASIINDIGAATQDPDMWKLVAESGAGYVCMHMQGTPESMQQNPTYPNNDALKAVRDFFLSRIEQICAQGVDPSQVMLDPGIGFGKSLHHNLQLLAGLRDLTSLSRPLLIGLSRKSFLAKLSRDDKAERLSGSLAGACWAVANGASLLRVHDVGQTARAIQLFETLASTTI